MSDKIYFMGQDVEGLPRERLIEIIAILGKQLDQTRSAAIASTRMMADAARAAVRGGKG